MIPPYDYAATGTILVILGDHPRWHVIGRDYKLHLIARGDIECDDGPLSTMFCGRHGRAWLTGNRDARSAATVCQLCVRRVLDAGVIYLDHPKRISSAGIEYDQGVQPEPADLRRYLAGR